MYSSAEGSHTSGPYLEKMSWGMNVQCQLCIAQANFYNIYIPVYMHIIYIYM